MPLFHHNGFNLIFLTGYGLYFSNYKILTQASKCTDVFVVLVVVLYVGFKHLSQKLQ